MLKNADTENSDDDVEVVAVGKGRTQLAMEAFLTGGDGAW